MSSPLQRAFDVGRRVPVVGGWAASLGYRFVAPYFLTVPMRLESMAPGRAAATLRPAPWTRNHLGGVHAIAQCNLAEFAMGAVAEATVPAATHRWIPRGMQVRYLAPARGRLRAVATLTLPEPLGDRRELVVPVEITDAEGTVTCAAEIAIWVTAR